MDRKISKSIVHDQLFLNDSKRLAYLQNTVTGAAEAEIQFLGEDGANYILALRMLKARFADSGKIVRAAIAALKVIHHRVLKIRLALQSCTKHSGQL